MSSPELWVVALLRWLLLCALSGAIGGIAGRALARGQARPGPAALPGPWALAAGMWSGMLDYTVRAAVAGRSGAAAVRRLLCWCSPAAAWLFTIVVPLSHQNATSQR